MTHIPEWITWATMMPILFAVIFCMLFLGPIMDWTAERKKPQLTMREWLDSLPNGIPMPSVIPPLPKGYVSEPYHYHR